MFSVHYTPKDYRFLTILINDEPWKEISISVFGRKPQFPKNFASLEDLNDWYQRYELKQAKNYALKRITLKSLHSQELRKIFHDHRISEVISEQIIAEFENQGYINDADWIEAYIRSQKAKKRGPRAILMKLRAKGIPIDSLEFDQDSNRESISKLLTSRFQKRDLSDLKERNKVIASLARKGFEFEDILQEINNLRNLNQK